MSSVKQNEKNPIVFVANKKGPKWESNFFKTQKNETIRFVCDFDLYTLLTVIIGFVMCDGAAAAVIVAAAAVSVKCIHRN